MKVIGLTGGIGSGKTTVAQIFGVMGVPVYNSDQQAKVLMENDSEIHTALVRQFGKDVFTTNGELNRKLISDLIFENESNLQWINSIVHPAVGQDFNNWKSKQFHPFVIKESALLIETLDKQSVDKIILVLASKALRLERTKQRDQVSESGVLKRMKNQLDDNERLKHADFIIENEGTRSLIKQVIDIHKKLMLYTLEK